MIKTHRQMDQRRQVILGLGAQWNATTVRVNTLRKQERTMKPRHQSRTTVRSTTTRKPVRRTKLRAGLTEEPFAPVGNAAGMPSPTTPIHVEMVHSSALRVCIAGSFNDWQPTDMVRMGAGKWAIDLTLIPGSYEYRLVVDGNWMADPNASHSVPNPFGEPNSLMVVPHRRRSMGSEAQESP
jgi:hypothetical protein